MPTDISHRLLGWGTTNILEAYTEETKTKETERGRWIETFPLLPGGRHSPGEGAASSKVLPPPREKFSH